MKRIITLSFTILMLWVATGIQAVKKNSMLTFEFPSDLALTCRKHSDLESAGLSAKANRLATDYRKKHLDKFFVLKPDEKRKIKLINNKGWEVGKAESLLFPYNLNIKDVDRLLNFTVELKIPEKALESWEDFFVNESQKKEIYEVTILIQSDYGGLVIEDCFNSHRHFALSVHGTLISYRARSQTNLTSENSPGVPEENANDNSNDNPGNENPNPQAGSWLRGATSQSPKPAEATMASPQKPKPTPVAKFKTSTSVPRTDDLHADMINAILTQHPDRYEFIKEVISAEPDRVDAMTMEITINIDSKFNSQKKTEAMGLLTSAVIAKDFQMVKFLIENGANICDGGPNNNLCAMGIAKKLGYQGIVDIMQAELQRRYEESKKKEQ